MINQSYIRVLTALELFAKEHLQVKRFASDFPEQLPNFSSESEQYPILFVSPNNSIFKKNQNTFDLTIYCYDLIQDGRGNINTILSDTNTILNDLYLWLRDGEVGGIEILSDMNCTPINNALLDYVAGWQMSLSIEVDTYNVCEIPFNEEPAILDVVNDIIYSKYLTCETLSNCSTIIDIESNISSITDDLNDKISDAPIDGNKYGRRNGNWEIIDISSSNYVPYIGATQSVDLGTYSLKANSLEVSTTPTEPIDIGKIVWNSSDGTFDMGLLNGVTLQAGQEMHMYAKASGVISNGDAVQFAGVQGSHLLIKKAVPSEINGNPEYFVGIATQDFTNNEFGYVTVFGQVRNIDTEIYPEGTVLYYQSSGTTNGLLTDVRPIGPKAKIIVAAVVRSHQNQGAIFVRPHVMPKIGDLQNIEISGVTDGQILSYDTTQEVWKNIDLPTQPISTLQEVTDVGNTTTNEIIISDGSLSTTIGYSSLYIENPTRYFDLSPDGISIGDSTGDNWQTSILTKTRTQNTNFYFEDEGGSKSIATREFVDDSKLITDLRIRRRGITVFDDMTATTSGVSPFVKNAFNSGIVQINTAITVHHQGIVGIASTTSAINGGGSILMANVVTARNMTITPGIQYDIIISSNSFSNNVFYRFGFISGTVNQNDVTDGFYFEWNGASLVAKTANGSVRSSSTTYTMLSGTWYHLRIKMTSTSLITYEVYNDNGDLLFNTTLSTNIPAVGTGTQPGFIGFNQTAENKTMCVIDYISATYPTMNRGALT